MASLVSSSPASAQTTLWVDDDGMAGPADCLGSDPAHVLISLAVAVSSSGDTIRVCPAAYTDSVTISHPLTVLGPNEDTSWDEVRGDEAAVTSPGTTFFMFPGDGVTLDGFTITGNFAIYVTGSANNTLIENNIVTGGVRALTSDSGGSNLTVLDNHLVSSVRSFHLDGAHTDMVVSRNQFSGPAPAAGIFFFGAPGNSIDGFTFTDNEVLHPANMAANISNATVSGNRFNSGLPGDETLLISLHESTVTNNIFEGDDEIACLLLWGSQFGLVPSENVTISDNVFNDCGNAGPSTNFAIHLSQNVRGIEITGNEIFSGVEGVNTDDTALWDVTDDIHINLNNITQNTTFGVRNGQFGVLDAECNWWGAEDGPGPPGGSGSGDNVSTNVDFTPWLTAPAPGGQCFGGLPSRVNGAGQINVSGGRANFGFNARSEGGPASGHLTYRNHASGTDLNCTVTDVTIFSPTQAHLEGTCSSRSSAASFEADVEDNGEPGKNVDQFVITYGATTEGGPLRAGNIQIRSSGEAAAATTSGAGAGTFPAGATFNGISLSGVQVGTGLSMASNGTATGQFVADLLGTSPLGQARTITVDGAVGSGSLGAAGSVTFSGVARVDIDDGSLPLLNVPFTATATTQSVLLSLGTSTLPSVPLTAGGITIE